MSAPSQEVARRTPVQEVVARMRGDQFLEQVALALPGNVRPERFVRAAVTAIMQNPEVVVHPESLFNSAIQCAQDGLIPDGREAAFVVFSVKGEKKVQYLPMIGGYRKIAAKHGFVLVADVVRERDLFDWSRMPPRVEHKPALGGDRGEVVCAYAAAFDRDWRFVTAPVVMDVPEIEKVRKVSRAATSEYGPWVNWWDRMACKTVARRLFNELPLGDLEEVDARIVEAADADADLPDVHVGLSTDEADIAAGLTTTPPVDREQPDDKAETLPATPDQHAALLELIVELGGVDAETDWQAAAVQYAQLTFEKSLVELTAGELDEVISHLRQYVPTHEEPTDDERSS